MPHRIGCAQAIRLSGGLHVVVERLGQIQQPTARALVEAVIGPDEVQRLLARHRFDFAERTAVPGPLSCLKSVIEIADRYTEKFGEIPKSGSGNSVSAAFVFLDLLKTHADGLGEVLLGQPQ